MTFATEPEFRFLGELGFLQRTDQQFHWENAGYASFDDFLAALTARKRKTIRRERHDALANGITVHWLTGSDLTEDVWDAFFEFYMETGSRKWGRPYLTRAFYSLIGETMRDRILLVMAKRAGRWIAGAINFIGSHTLFGRHWGAIEHHPFLHFELCYYQAIDYAIAHKLPRVEAGAQGEHKISRGYMPTTTYSAHYIADPALRRAIADYLVRERAYVAAAGAELAATRRRIRKDAGGRERLIMSSRSPRENAMTSYDPEQHFCQNPARRTAGAQSIRGRPRVRVSGHHAAGAGPHAGDPEGAGAQHSGCRRGRSRACDQSDATHRSCHGGCVLRPMASRFSNSTSPPADRWCSTCISTSFRARPAFRSNRRPVSRKSQRSCRITRRESPQR